MSLEYIILAVYLIIAVLMFLTMVDDAKDNAEYEEVLEVVPSRTRRGKEKGLLFLIAVVTFLWPITLPLGWLLRICGVLDDDNNDKDKDE